MGRQRSLWEDFDSPSLSTLKRGEQFELEIKSGELLLLRTLFGQNRHLKSVTVKLYEWAQKIAKLQGHHLTALVLKDERALVDEGLRNSPSYASAQATLKAAREQLRGQIGDNLFPKIDLEFNPSRQRSLGIPVLPQQTFIENIFVAQAKASYTFDFFGTAFLADRALAGQVKQQALQLEATRRALVTNIVVATINSASMAEQVAATEALVNLGEERARHRGGGVGGDGDPGDAPPPAVAPGRAARGDLASWKASRGW